RGAEQRARHLHCSLCCSADLPAFASLRRGAPKRKARRRQVCRSGRPEGLHDSNQKSICALTLTNRACRTEFGCSQLPAGFAAVGRTNAWLYVNTAALLNTL